MCAFRDKDIDAMSVVYHGNHLKYFEVGRVLRDHGLAMSEVDRRLRLPVVKSFVRDGRAVTAASDSGEAGTPGRGARGHHPGQ
jgi:acyl-CoA thioesterase FadM